MHCLFQKGKGARESPLAVARNGLIEIRLFLGALLTRQLSRPPVQSCWHCVLRWDGPGGLPFAFVSLATFLGSLSSQRIPSCSRNLHAGLKALRVLVVLGSGALAAGGSLPVTLEWSQADGRDWGRETSGKAQPKLLLRATWQVRQWRHKRCEPARSRS